MLQLHVPVACAAEVAYAATVVFGDFLGLAFTLAHEPRQDIVVEGPGPGRLVMDASFFVRGESDWLGAGSLPTLPLAGFDTKAWPGPLELVAPVLPVLYGAPTLTLATDEVQLGLDLLGSAFFMLSRYEEAVLPERDQHDRFPAEASLACRAGFLDRPIVNEYVELLWACLSHLWPDLKRRERTFRCLPTHDVDEPFLHAFLPPRRFYRHVLAELVRGRWGGLPAKVATWRRVQAGELAADPYNTFAWIMAESERRQLQSAFYFFGGRPDPLHDARYDLTDPRILALIAEIGARGHAIGLHPSYTTYLDPARTRHEADQLREAWPAAMGGRQHYLRWRTPATMRNWEAAGLGYDSTLGFADRAGFRCGTCYEYPLYDVAERRELALRERPLIAMECTVTDQVYMGLGHGEEARACFKTLIERCRLFDGDFVLLWHNARLVTPEDRALYADVLDAAVGGQSR